MRSRKSPVPPLRGFALCLWFVFVAAPVAAAAREASTAARPTTAPATQPAGPSFSVATYNINYGNPDLRRVVQAIRQADADLVCLQETNTASDRYLRRYLTASYRHIRFRNDPSWAGGFGFLSKAPLKGFQYIPPKHGPFGSWLCVAKLGGKDVQVAGVHLQPMLPRQGATTGQLLAQIRQSDAVRGKEIAYLHGRLAPRLPVIVAGDMNAPPYLASAKYLTGKGFTDSFHAANPNAKDPFTWHWRWRGVDWRFRLDYIYHSQHMHTHASRVVAVEASDHYLVVSQFRWAPAEAATATTAPARPGRPRRP